MGWDALAAVGSISSTIILLIAALAAIVQIKHLRLANQLTCYLELLEIVQSSEMVEARRFVENTDFRDPGKLEAAISPDLDQRIRMIGAFYQNVARLINFGLLDEQLFLVYYSTAPRIWKSLVPVVHAVRARTGVPMLVDFEYMVYRISRERPILKAKNRYPKDFLESCALEGLFESNQRAASEALAEA